MVIPPPANNHKLLFTKIYILAWLLSTQRAAQLGHTLGCTFLAPSHGGGTSGPALFTGMVTLLSSTFSPNGGFFFLPLLSPLPKPWKFQNPASVFLFQLLALSNFIYQSQPTEGGAEEELGTDNLVRSF